MAKHLDGRAEICAALGVADTPQPRLKAIIGHWSTIPGAWMVKRNVVLEFEFKGAHLTSMVFKFLARRMRKRSEQHALNVNMFQLLSRALTHDLYLDVQIHIPNALANAQTLTSGDIPFDVEI
jgi:hypothetical protein